MTSQNSLKEPLAVAIFVKTPGLSPVKTRLAKGIGADAALAFYRLACAAVAAVLEDAPGVVPYWAVAEPAGGASWSGFPTLLQGSGGLGERLDHVYATLLATGAAPVLVGGDAPQISAGVFAAVTAAFAAGHDFVMGPAADGGFYLLAGRRPVPQAVWTAVTYSASTTAQTLARALEAIGRLAWLPVLTDADEQEDLAAVAGELAALPRRLPEQDALAAWLARAVES